MVDSSRTEYSESEYMSGHGGQRTGKRRAFSPKDDRMCPPCL